MTLTSHLVGLSVLALLASSSAKKVTVHDGGDVLCDDPLSADQLTKAVDAALMELNQVKGFFDSIKNEHGFPTVVKVADCAANDAHWHYPEAATATGLLKRVLQTGEIRMAGVQWGPYKEDPPAGFWPDYGTAIVERISAHYVHHDPHYGQPIKLVRVYYANSKIVADKVSEALEVEMSEPYYYLSGFHELSPSQSTPRIEHFAFSCITAATPSSFFTRKDSGIADLHQLNVHIRANPDERNVGFIGQGNYDSVSGVLTEEAQPRIGEDADILDSDAMERMVAKSPLLLIAGYSSEGPEGVNNSAGLFNVFSTGLVSPRVILYREEDADCYYNDNGSMNTAAIISVSVLGSVTILLSLALVVGVFYERRGAPIFMSLNEKTSTSHAAASAI